MMISYFTFYAIKIERLTQVSNIFFGNYILFQLILELEFCKIGISLLA